MLLWQADGVDMHSTCPPIVSHAFPLYHFQVNLRAKQRATFKQASEKKSEAREEKQAVGSSYHDSRMTVLTSQRSRKQFKFNEPGRDGWVCKRVREVGGVWMRRNLGLVTALHDLWVPGCDQKKFQFTKSCRPVRGGGGGVNSTS